jgi:membrane protein implicated in regulation of membrane protease activity
MDYPKLLSLIATLTGTLMTISYFGFATKKGWKIGKMFAKGSTWTIISSLLMVAGIFFSFKYFVWWHGGLIIIGSWLLAVTLTHFLKSASQLISTLLILAGMTLFFIGFAQKIEPTSATQNKSIINDSVIIASPTLDTSAAVETNVKRQSAIDTILQLVDISLKSDKNFEGTISVIVKNISHQSITNILLREGRSSCATLSQDNKSKETNYPVNLKPGDTKAFTFKTRSNDLALQPLTDPIGIIKVRFTDGQVAVDYCNELTSRN